MNSVYVGLFYTILGLSLGYIVLKIYPKIERNTSLGAGWSIALSILSMVSIYIPSILVGIGMHSWLIFAFIPLIPFIALKMWENYRSLAPFISVLGFILPIIFTTNAKWWQILSPIIFFGLFILMILPFTINAANILDVSWIKAFLPLSVTSLLAILITATFNSMASMSKMDSTSPGGGGGARWSLGILSVIGLFVSYFIGKGDGNFFTGFGTFIPLAPPWSPFWKAIGAKIIVPLLIAGITILYGWLSNKYFENYNEYYSKIPRGFTAGLWIINTLIILFGLHISTFLYAKLFDDENIQFWHVSRIWRIIRENIFSFEAIKFWIGFLIIICLIVLFIYFAVNNPNVAIIMIQIILALGLLFAIFKYLMAHPRILEAITSNTILRLIFDILFVIPCMFYYLFEESDLSISKTTIIVFVIELIILLAYVLLPMFRKWLYLWTPFKRRGTLSKEKRTQAANQSAYNAKEEFKKATQIPTDTSTNYQVPIDASGIEMWKHIYENDLYKPEKKDSAGNDLLSYLEATDTFHPLGYLSKVFEIITGPSKKNIPKMVEWIQNTSDKPTNMKNVMIKLKKFAELTKRAEKLNNDTDTDHDAYKSTILLNKPHYINKIKYLGQFENLSSGNHSVQNPYNYNYGLSLWVYILPQGSEYGVGYSNDTKVFDYAGKPTILFNPDKNLFKIMVQTDISNTQVKDETREYTEPTPVDTLVYKTYDFPMQKWNNIFINYFGSTLDIFINNKLVTSVNNVIPYMSIDSITAGQQQGISGSVSAITYFSQPVSKAKMTLLYNSLVNKNPPII
jgi:hypothetical protein